jgi:hypothetical protein
MKKTIQRIGQALALTAILATPGVANADRQFDAANRAGNQTFSDLQKDKFTAYFTPIEKDYLISGKMPETLKHVKTLAKELSTQDNQVTVEDLLDLDYSNHEFVGLHFDTSNPFRRMAARLYIKPIEGEYTEATFKEALDGKAEQERGLGTKMPITQEVNHMKENIPLGLELEKEYQAIDSKKEDFTFVLDAQAGLVEDYDQEWTPRFERQMGFRSEEEMRNILTRTENIQVTYVPQDASTNMVIGKDFEIVYTLEDGEEVVKYVGNFPLANSLKSRDMLTNDK